MRPTATNALQPPAPAENGPTLQRKCACAASGGSCARCEGKSSSPRRAGTFSTEPSVPPIVDDVLASPGVEIEGSTRRMMEARFQHDFSGVRLHDDANANLSARALGAVAYSGGPHVVFGLGSFQSGRRNHAALLAHELAHVVQQDRGGADTLGVNTDPVLEAEADSAAARFVRGAPHIAVSGRGDGGIARATKVLEVDEEKELKKRPSQATMTTVQQRPSNDPPQLPVREINDSNKAKGTLGELTVPFDRYPGWDWNHIGGGAESASSRTNLARVSGHDKRFGQEGTAGFDYLVENVKTGRLVIGEQKATGADEFTRATATTTSLEVNLGHTVETLQRHLDSGAVKDPSEVARLGKTIERLRATEATLKSGRAGDNVKLPDGVVFELTNLGGAGKQFGKEYIDRLAKAAGDHPEFLEHLLSRTFVRDPELAKRHGRDPNGRPGTDSDPGIVPASELLTPRARDEMARRRSGKTPREWEREKAAQKAAEQRAQRDTERARKKTQRDAHAAAAARARAEAKRTGEQVRQEHLRRLQEDDATKHEPSSLTERQRDKAQQRREREAQRAGKQAEKSSLEEFQVQRRRDAAEARAQRAEQLRHEAEVRRQQREAAQDAPSKHAAEKPVADRKPLTAEERAGYAQKRERILRMNEDAQRVHLRNTALSKGAHTANQLAAGVRAYDAFLDARDQGKGGVESAFAAGKTYLENTNVVFGTLATAQQRQQKDASGEQYYGDDAVDAWLGTVGETAAGFVVPGAGWDQAVNAGANLIGAVDDHRQRGRDPNDPAAQQATLRTATDLAAELTPSRAFAQITGAGLRGYYDVGRAIGGDTRGVEKFGEDAVRGKLGAVIQPWAMAADFAGNLGSDSVEVALAKTIKKTEGTTLKKMGDAAGDAVYALGQSKETKSGKQGMAVQGISMSLGITSDLVAGKSFEQALNDAAEAGKGSLADTVGSAIGEATYKAVERGKEFVDEDLPAAKQKLEHKIDETKDRLKKLWKRVF